MPGALFKRFPSTSSDFSFLLELGQFLLLLLFNQSIYDVCIINRWLCCLMLVFKAAKRAHDQTFNKSIKYNKVNGVGTVFFFFVFLIFFVAASTKIKSIKSASNCPCSTHRRSEAIKQKGCCFIPNVCLCVCAKWLPVKLATLYQKI